jgi:hypothetical protein
MLKEKMPQDEFTSAWENAKKLTTAQVVEIALKGYRQE